ncbi:MAG: tetratricopeptide repeat protein, partial [Desulfobacterales bacterium]|nr:tetratricopeptide repeat protein [Desulfobacterales bacterium]
VKHGEDRTKSARPTISACMIVKNEEKMLPQCLESIKDYVNEIVVVDTGSTDSTVEIAESHGARVYHHPWEDNFSKHRNQSIGYAGSDWIFIIDADEELMPGSGEEIQRAAQVDDNVDSIFIRVECDFDEGRGTSMHNSLRLFRNNNSIRYKGRVHNAVVGEQNPKYAPKARIFHYGYNLGPEMAGRKFKRTSKLLKLDIVEDPSDPRPHHYLGVSYLSACMFELAAKESELAIEFYKGKNLVNSEALKSYFVASMAYINLAEFDKAESLAHDALKIYPKHLDSHFALSWVYLEKKELTLFWRHIQSYFEINKEIKERPELFGTITHTSISSDWFAHYLKACAYILEGDHEKSKLELDNALSLCPDRSEMHRLLGRYHRITGESAKAEEEFLKSLSCVPNKRNVMWELCLLCREQGDLDKEQEYLERFIETDSEDTTALFAMGILFMKKGDFERALSIFKEVLKLNEDHFEAKINKGLCLRKLKRYDDAIEWTMRARKQNPESLEALSSLAHCYYETKEFGLALRVFNEIASLYPDEPDVHIYLSKLYLLQNDIEPCVRSCDELLRILELERDIILNSLVDMGTQFFKIGKKLVQDGKPFLAKICFDIGISLGKDSSDDLIALGKSLFANNAFEIGISYLEKAASLDPNNLELISTIKQYTMNFENA